MTQLKVLFEENMENMCGAHPSIESVSQTCFMTVAFLFDPAVIVARAFAMAPLLGSVEAALASRADL